MSSSNNISSDGNGNSGRNKHQKQDHDVVISFDNAATRTAMQVAQAQIAPAAAATTTSRDASTIATSNDYDYDPLSRGDPRMNLAVETKLKDPNCSLSKAIQVGGFLYPCNGDATAMDVENVSLGQRKNQLNRRLRQARLNLHYQEQGDQKKKGSENDDAGVSFATNGAVEEEGTMIMFPRKRGSCSSTQEKQNHNMKQAALETEGHRGEEIQAPGRASQGNIINVLQLIEGHPSRVVQSTLSNTVQIHPQGQVQGYHQMQLSGLQHHEQQQMQHLQLQQLHQIQQSQQLQQDNQMQQRQQQLPSELQVAQQQHPHQGQNQQVYQNRPLHSSPDNNESISNMLQSPYSGPHAPDVATMPPCTSVDCPHAADGNGSSTTSLNNGVSTGTTSPQQQGRHHHDPLYEQQAGGSLFDNGGSYGAGNERMENGLSLFQSGLHSLYLRSMLQAGFTYHECMESSTSYQGFAFLAWKRECERLQVVMNNNDGVHGAPSTLALPKEG